VIISVSCLPRCPVPVCRTWPGPRRGGPVHARLQRDGPSGACPDRRIHKHRSRGLLPLKPWLREIAHLYAALRRSDELAPVHLRAIVRIPVLGRCRSATGSGLPTVGRLRWSTAVHAAGAAPKAIQTTWCVDGASTLRLECPAPNRGSLPVLRHQSLCWDTQPKPAARQ